MPMWEITWQFLPSDSTSQTGRSLLTKGRAEGAAPTESSEYAWLCNLRGP